MLGGKRAHVGQVLLGIRPGFLGQVAQEGDHLLGRLGHLGHQRHIGVVAVAEQCGFFLPQRQQLGHDRAVVELGSVARGLLARAGDVRAVELFAQGPMGAKLHDGQVDRHLEAEFVAGFALGLGGGRGGGNHVLGHTVELLAFHIERKTVGGIERVLAEFLTLFGLSLLDGGKTFFCRTLQLSAAEHKAAQCVVVGAGLLGCELGRVHGFVLGVQALVGAQAGPELGDAGQGGVVGGAQLGSVGHAVEVADRAPGTAQAFGCHVQGLGDGRPVGGEVGGGHGLQRSVGGGQQGVHGGRHMLGPNGVEQGQAGGVEQGVGRVGHGVSGGVGAGSFNPATVPPGH